MLGMGVGSGESGTTFPGPLGCLLQAPRFALATPPRTCTSQSTTCLSQPPDASCFESGLKLTVSTLLW